MIIVDMTIDVWYLILPHFGKRQYNKCSFVYIYFLLFKISNI